MPYRHTFMRRSLEPVMARYRTLARSAAAALLLLSGCGGGGDSGGGGGGTPSDTSPPIFSGVTVGVGTLTSDQATVTWNTDEPSTSQVLYGITRAYASSSTLDSTLVTSHSVTLYNLTPSTTYYLKAKSIDSAGNPNTSIEVIFTTPSSYF
ncbi:MAG TPA: fibronectin type III domain-containing protein, partial [Nitrospiria bacterium]|nr:fibronectin type III domain-containing protein [Nitrospiria bacterium]